LPPPQAKCLPQIVWVRRFSHRFHRIHRNSCWGYSPTDFTEFTEAAAGDILPQISQICTDCLGAFKGVHLSQVHQHSKRCTNIARGAPTEQEVHQPSKKCTNVARLGVCQNSQAVRPEGAEAHSPGQRPGYFVFIMNNAPCKGNTLIIRLLPLQGVGLVLGIFTQGAALGYVLLPLRGVTLASFDTP
jgi:hypothetical protein